MKDIVSVIIPVYNVELYVERCIRSIQKQKYQNIEIIIIDDGSTDNSLCICEELAKQDSRIMVFHKDNGGLSSARNYGLNIAKGKYIAFVDSDDYVHEEYISLMYEIAVKSGADIVISGYKTGRTGGFENTKLKGAYVVYLSKEVLENWHRNYKFIETVAWNKLYKKELFLNNNICYPIGFLHEDIQTTHLLVATANKIAITEEKLYFYVKRDNSITAVISDKEISDNIWSQNVRLQYFKEHKYIKTYRRLNIERQKYYMFYYSLIYEKTFEDVKENMLKGFNANYSEIMNYAETKWKEKVCFYIFKRGYKIINCFFREINKLNII